MQLDISLGPFSPIQIYNDTTTYRVASTNGTISFKDPWNTTWQFTLSNFTVHAPSEHTFNGAHYDLEMQFYHKDSSSNTAALAIFFDRSAGGNSKNSLIDNLNVDIYTSTASW